MIVDTYRFGELLLETDDLITMPDGLVGLTDLKRFYLIEEIPERPFRWLQSIDEPGLAFAVVDPYDFFLDYECEVDDTDASLLGITGPEDAAIFTLLTISPDGREVTANLVAPVIVCTETRKAKQVILSGDRYTTRHQLVSGVAPVVASSAA
jgi:flagellar assembly factor FliW